VALPGFEDFDEAGGDAAERAGGDTEAVEAAD
jgi:hypothetical protein